MAAISPAHAAQLIRASAGRFFGCTFKKADGTVREMRCRYAEVRQVQKHGDPSSSTIAVWDDGAQAWRSIPTARLIELRLDGQTLEVAQ